ncbi:MAG: DUF1071 domain-containing protein [Clostridiales bacterium]|nr:DUF1071 domain-containing protein [Clostridiales bacterium]
MTEKNFFEQLYDIDVRDRMYQKQGLSYIPWSTAWSEVCKVFPEATYEIKKFGENSLPYVESDLGIMVFTSVTVNGITREMELPVMDGSNKAMKSVEYTYKTKSGERTVAPATMFDVNKSIMRCLAKNLAMFGLGLHLWSKEEAPESVIELEKLQKECMDLIKKRCALSDNTKIKVGEICKTILEDETGNPINCEDNEKLTLLSKELKNLRKIV